MRGISVAAECGADAVEFVGCDSGTDTAPANQQSNLSVAVLDGVANLFRVVRIIVGNGAVVSAEVDQIITGAAQFFDDPLVERVTSMIRGNRYSHNSYNNARACFKTLSTLNPSSRNATSPGADAPNRSRHTTSPDDPTYRSQPCLTPASTASRAVTVGGNTSSRYSCDCSSNSSQQGIDTTRVGTLSASNFSRASSASETSDPVAIRITRGVSAS